MLTDPQRKDLSDAADARLHGIAARILSARGLTPAEAETEILIALSDAYKAGAEDVAQFAGNAIAAIGRAVRAGADDLPHDMEGRLSPSLAAIAELTMHEAAE